VGGDVGRPCTLFWAGLGQAAPDHRWAKQAMCTVRVGRPRGFRPIVGILKEIPFSFLSRIISNSNFEKFISHCSELQKS
jgi:hypothetical protein